MMELQQTNLALNDNEMSRQIESKIIVLATHNKGKLEELKHLLSGTGIEVRTAGDLDVPEPDETGETFEENAILKAKHATEKTGYIAIGDDSGLMIPALGENIPGLRTKEYAYKHGGFPAVFEHLEKILVGQDHYAFFKTVIAVSWPDGHVETFTGTAEGELKFPPIGESGFGYDPIFQIEGSDKRYAQMELHEKNQTCSRAIALRRAIDACLKRD